MRKSDVFRRAGIAGALFFGASVLDVILGGGVPDAVHGIVGLFGLALLAVSAAAGAGWPEDCPRHRPYRGY